MSNTTSVGTPANQTANVVPLRPVKPNYLAADFDGIPDELKSLPNWVCWRAETPKPGKTKWRKVPYNPLEYTERRSAAAASTTDPRTWRGFDEAVQAYCDSQKKWKRPFDGIGFVFDGAVGEDGLCYCGIDLDKWTDKAQAISGKVASYTELSPSRNGVHIIARALPFGQETCTTEALSAEAYCTGRYFTFSGRLIGGSVETIEARPDEIAEVLAEIKVYNPAIAVGRRGRQTCDRLRAVGGSGVRIHHLNCGSLCPRGGRLLGSAGGPLSPAPMCCHCLLIEGDDRLILIDAGIGVEDVHEPRRLGLLFNTMARPRLEVAETALRQVVDLGYRPSDVRHIVPTHLDLDHAGGICDFPDAAVHVFAAELRAASHRSSLSERSRYRAVQIAAVKKWVPVEEGGESWFGFSAVRAIPGTRDEVLLVPLPGHTRGHCGVAVRRADDWLLHCGDAYFHRSEVAPDGGAAPKGLRWLESMVDVDGPQRRANQARLRELARLGGGEVKLICSHDFAEFAAMRSAEREARREEEAAPQPVSPPRPVPQRDLRARR